MELSQVWEHKETTTTTKKKRGLALMRLVVDLPLFLHSCLAVIIKDQEYLDFLQWLKDLGCPKTKLTLAEFSSEFAEKQLRSFVCLLLLYAYGCFRQGVSQK